MIAVARCCADNLIHVLKIPNGDASGEERPFLLAAVKARHLEDGLCHNLSGRAPDMSGAIEPKLGALLTKALDHLRALGQAWPVFTQNLPLLIEKGK